MPLAKFNKHCMLRLNKILIVTLFIFISVLGWTKLAQAQVAATPIVCNLSDFNDDQGKPLENKSWILPDCVYFEGNTDTETQKQCGCRNINVFIQLLIKAANVILMMVGGVALIMFIYGGFVLLTAAGGDNVKKGKDTLVAAVIGLVIIFSAQLLLNFVLTTIFQATATSSNVEKCTPADITAGKCAAPTEVQGVQIIVPEKK